MKIDNFFLFESALECAHESDIALPAISEVEKQNPSFPYTVYASFQHMTVAHFVLDCVECNMLYHSQYTQLCISHN